MILVPINRASKASLRGEPPHRQDLDAEDDILGIALAFPGSGSKKVGESYIQVRLPDPPDYVEADELSVEEDDG